jgi:hypothetical protein
MHKLIQFLYAYCTDFIINLANLSGLSYYEVNFFIFCVIYPLLLIISPLWYAIQLLRLRKSFRQTQMRKIRK